MPAKPLRSSMTSTLNIPFHPSTCKTFTFSFLLFLLNTFSLSQSIFKQAKCIQVPDPVIFLSAAPIAKRTQRQHLTVPSPFLKNGPLQCRVSLLMPSID